MVWGSGTSQDGPSFLQEIPQKPEVRSVQSYALEIARKGKTTIPALEEESQETIIQVIYALLEERGTRLIVTSEGEGVIEVALGTPAK